MKKRVLSLVLAVMTVVAVVVGCANTESAGTSTDTNGTTETTAGTGETIKIGLLYSITGEFSLSETPMLRAAQMAIEEINENGGIDGKMIEAIEADYGSDPAMANEKAQELILKEEVVAIIGTNASSTRLAVTPTIEQYDALLVYNTYYEGEVPSPNLIYTNTVPSQQIADYIPWIVENLGKKVFFVGSDYEFPRKSIAYAKALLEEVGGEIVGEEYTPTGATEFSSIVNKIKDAEPDVVFSAVAGNSTVPFYIAYSQYGMDMEEMPIASISMHEAAVKGVGEAAIGSYASFSYFNSIDTPESKAFVEKFTEKFGNEITTTNLAEGAYHGVYLLAKAIETAESLKTADLIAAFSGLEVDTPAGAIKMDEENHHAWLNAYIGRVNEDLGFDIVRKSDGLVAPIVD